MSSSKSQKSDPTRRRDDPSRRVEVTVAFDHTGERLVVLKDMSFGNGVGWYTEKSVSLDSKQVEALLRSLCACRQHPSLGPRADCAEAADDRSAGQTLNNGGGATILTFPTILPGS